MEEKRGKEIVGKLFSLLYFSLISLHRPNLRTVVRSCSLLLHHRPREEPRIFPFSFLLSFVDFTVSASGHPLFNSCHSYLIIGHFCSSLVIHHLTFIFSLHHYSVTHHSSFTIHHFTHIVCIHLFSYSLLFIIHHSTLIFFTVSHPVIHHSPCHHTTTHPLPSPTELQDTHSSHSLHQELGELPAVSPRLVRCAVPYHRHRYAHRWRASQALKATGQRLRWLPCHAGARGLHCCLSCLQPLAYR